MSLNSKGKRIDEDLATVSVRKSKCQDVRKSKCQDGRMSGRVSVRMSGKCQDEIFDGLISHS